MRLRRVDPIRDAIALDALQRDCLPHDEPCEYKPRDVWHVAFDGALPVGFCCVRPTSSTPSIWYLARAGVVPEARGRGLQKRMIRTRLSAAKRAGASSVVTDCTLDNAASANSLIACGFRVFTPRYRWALPRSIYWRKKL